MKLLEGCLELQPELGVTRCWIFGLHIGSHVDFGQYNYRVMEHHIACFGPMDFIYGLGYHYSGPDCLLSVTYILD